MSPRIALGFNYCCSRSNDHLNPEKRNGAVKPNRHSKGYRTSLISTIAERHTTFGTWSFYYMVSHVHELSYNFPLNHSRLDSCESRQWLFGLARIWAILIMAISALRLISPIMAMISLNFNKSGVPWLQPKPARRSRPALCNRKKQKGCHSPTPKSIIGIPSF